VIAAPKANTLILAHRLQLMKQWVPSGLSPLHRIRVFPPITAPGSYYHQCSGGLFAQYIAYRQDQITSEIIRSFSVWIFDSVVAGIVSELSVLEFAVPILDNLSAHLPAEEIVEGFGFGLAARINYYGAAVFYGAGDERVLKAIAQSCHGQRSRIYLRMTRSAHKQKT
jgi:hypothetical protein